MSEKFDRRHFLKLTTVFGAGLLRTDITQGLTKNLLKTDEYAKILSLLDSKEHVNKQNVAAEFSSTYPTLKKTPTNLAKFHIDAFLDHYRKNSPEFIKNVQDHYSQEKPKISYFKAMRVVAIIYEILYFYHKQDSNTATITTPKQSFFSNVLQQYTTSGELIAELTSLYKKTKPKSGDPFSGENTFSHDQDYEVDRSQKLPVGTVSYSEAKVRLEKAGYAIRSSRFPKGETGSNKGLRRTCLHDLLETTVVLMEALAQDIKKKFPGTELLITGGTEMGHKEGTYSHGNGYCIDMASNFDLSRYFGLYESNQGGTFYHPKEVQYGSKTLTYKVALHGSKPFGLHIHIASQ